jgi:hypothetical protein
MTLVTAFVPNLNTALDNQSTYIARGTALLNVEVPKIVFTPKEIIAQLPHNKWNFFVPYDLPEESETFTLPAKRNKDKDTQKFFALMNEKTNFCRKAIQLNPFKTTQFVWVDFGLLHVCNKDTFARNLRTVVSKSYEKVRIAHIWPLSNVVPDYNAVQWYFAGGVFGGDAASLLRFADRADRQLLKLREKKIATWEVNVWASVFCEEPNLFDAYSADHNDSLLLCY